MLKTLKDSPFRNLNDANLRNQKFPILEIFIQLFLSELSLLVKRGIKKNYVEKTDNLKYIK
jgi:5-methylcytosine-specific restriction enzyme subunit McrC